MKTTSARISRSFLLLALLGCMVSVPAFAAPYGLGFKGALEDGGKFFGSVLYGDQDMEGVSPSNPGGVPDFGRFLGGRWHVDILGGSTTISAQLDKTTGGRAVVETRLAPNLMGLYVLGPNAGELPRLSLMFETRAGYDPDVQPTRADIIGFFFTLSAGAKSVSSGFQDRNGVFTKIKTIELWDATAALMNQTTVNSTALSSVPVPGGLGLMAGALGLLLPTLRRRAR